MLAESVEKNGEAVTVKIDGKGPVGQIVADSDSNGHVKGYIQNPHVHLPLNANHKLMLAKQSESMALLKSAGLPKVKILIQEPFRLLPVRLVTTLLTIWLSQSRFHLRLAFQCL